MKETQIKPLNKLNLLQVLKIPYVIILPSNISFLKIVFLMMVFKVFMHLYFYSVSFKKN